jgi:hypothetical protein
MAENHFVYTCTNPSTTADPTTMMCDLKLHADTQKCDPGQPCIKVDMQGHDMSVTVDSGQGVDGHATSYDKCKLQRGLLDESSFTLTCEQGGNDEGITIHKSGNLMFGVTPQDDKRQLQFFACDNQTGYC